MSRIVWSEKSEFEVLKCVNDELIRLNLTDRPARNDYLKLRNKNTTPSLSTLKKIWNLGWQDLLEKLGYNSLQTASRWRKLDDKKYLDAVLKAMKKNNIFSAQKYAENITSDVAPIKDAIVERFGTFSVVQAAYVLRYGAPKKKSSIRWCSLEKRRILEAFHYEIERTNSQTSRQYGDRYDKSRAPSFMTVRELLSDNVNERLYQIYQDKYGEELFPEQKKYKKRNK